MDQHYQPEKFETKIYALWEKSGAYMPKKSDRSGFSITMPPPNANDPLHIGHAVFISIEDILIRYHRMLGEPTVWLPGTDHAGIETQYVYEKKLAKQGKSRFDFSRQELYEQIWQYVQENSGVAVEQMKKLGASAAWPLYKFTLDKDVVNFVLDTFKKLYKDGLIYRDYRLVNFSPAAGTSYSNLEVVYKDTTSPLYYIRYFLLDEKDRPTKHYLLVATTRPEPIFADTHLAVHPKDKRWKKYVGRQVANPLTQAPMTVVADEFVDRKFGTGVVKLTPAHDWTDYEVAKRLKLPMIQAIDTRGKITANGGKYAGLKVKVAREQVVKDLTVAGYVEKIDQHYKNRVAYCYRTGQPIEPLLMPQFFVKVNDPKNSLVAKVLEAIETKATKIHGAGREKVLRHWLENLEDWNISRQIVWGIPIPVEYEIDGFEDQIEVSFITDKGERKFGRLDELLKEFSLEEVTRGKQQVLAGPAVKFRVSRVDGYINIFRTLPETDTFDTWFSSAQWPLVTLATNSKLKVADFYPTSVMETGYDILPFWVMRMMLICTYLSGKTPFKDVYLHGLIRDEKGQKMSKSKGNVINPLETIKQYGADALRWALVVRSTPGQDRSVGPADFKAARNLTNKLWNSTRYVIGSLNKNNSHQPNNQAGDDKQTFQQQLRKVVKDVSQQLDKLRPGLAADRLYEHFWHWYCDQVIENHKKQQVSDENLLEGLMVFLKLFHPFIPFVSEVLWQELVKAKLVRASLLIEADWPQS